MQPFWCADCLSVCIALNAMKQLRTIFILVSALLVGGMQSCDKIIEDIPPTPQPPLQTLRSIEQQTYHSLSNEPVAIDLVEQSGLSTAGSFKIERQPIYGDLVFLQKGIILYIPDPTAVALEDQFVYSVVPTSNVALSSLKDTVLIAIHPNASRLPCNAGAMHDEAKTTQNSSVSIPVLTNDRFCNVTLDSASLRVEIAPKNGTTNVANNKIVYTPNSGFKGSDILTYKVCSVGDKPVCRLATVDIGIEPTPAECRTTIFADALQWKRIDAPRDTSIVIDVLKNDILCTGYQNSPISISKAPQNGKATVTKDNKILYIPNDTFSGTESFEYRICDKDGKNCLNVLILVYIELPDPNCMPIARDDEVLASISKPAVVLPGAPSGSIEVVVWLNDKTCTDLKEVTILTKPNFGDAKADKLRVFYIPTPGFVGEDTFDYEITNINGQKSTASITVKIVK